MGKFAADLIASMKQAAAHAGGRKVRGMRVTKVSKPPRKVRPRAGVAGFKPKVVVKHPRSNKIGKPRPRRSSRPIGR